MFHKDSPDFKRSNLCQTLKEGFELIKIIKKNSLKIARPTNQFLLNIARHLLTQRDQLVGIILGDDGLQHLICDRRKHHLLIIDAELLIDLGQL